MFNRGKSLIKNVVLNRLNIPYSKFGLPICLLPYFNKTTGPINVIDVGAHRGDFVGTILHHSDIEKAILVEPIPELAHYLQERFKETNFSIFNCALSDTNAIVDFELNEATATSSLLKINRNMPELADIGLGKATIIQCETHTLDDVICSTKLDSIYLLKIDVQGAEHLVLKGGIETLKKTTLIWIEISFKPLYKEACTFFDIYELLNNAGFVLKCLEPAFYAPDGELLQSDALFVKKGE